MNSFNHEDLAQVGLGTVHVYSVADHEPGPALVGIASGLNYSVHRFPR
jgi:hypothetical protein